MWQAAVERPGAAVVGASRLRQTVEAKGGWSTARYALRSRPPDQQGRRQGRPSPARDRGNPGQVISAANPTTTQPRSSGLRRSAINVQTIHSSKCSGDWIRCQNGEHTPNARQKPINQLEVQGAAEMGAV